MPITKNALIRYKTIDKCLQNIYRLWTLEDLIEACSQALFEYENKAVNVSKRTIQLDIQMMRSDKLGYNAPIEVFDRKYYRYAEEDYSITNIPITEGDMSVLSETVEMLKQFKDFSLFSELGGIIQKLEDKVYTEKTNSAPVIHLDKNENLKGLVHLDVLYQSIIKKVCLKLSYRSFKARSTAKIVFHPYLLKEFNNRWFLVGKKNYDKSIRTLALDRIVKIDFDFSTEYEDENFKGDEYYKDTIGVTVLSNDYLKDVILKIDKKNAPYVLTKPLHGSQKILENHEDGGIIIQLRVHLNFEFERLILGFGNSAEVIEPEDLRTVIKKKLKRAWKQYESPV
ncbi:helix-turn-helix transcriptional regulator [Arcticibacterium luteifluviistationis]|uniref:WYL domain-containing protein n=1 Tax=Arcticibacterium luteifluviistationis TaxID=1784714 RepID=A0A2Z4GBM3_9BACT|nr:WYL domain-containing protein [Arcticibacterium luteifluviistationis]AWV98534.1 WYL domain-containing protein [Arcticibacterium luteifluviistationis]